MKVLVLSGEVTHQRPISYGLSSDWEVSVLSLIDTELLMICEKYGDARNVSSAETISFLKRAYDRAVAHIAENDIDVIVGVGYGAHILMNLNISYEWRGPSVFVLSEGSVKYNFVPRPLLDEVEFDTRPVRSAWVAIGDKAKNRNNRREKLEFDRGIAVHMHVFEQSWEKTLYSTGMLKSLIEAIL